MGVGGLDTQRDQVPVRSQFAGLAQRCPEAFAVQDHVIGRQYGEHCIWGGALQVYAGEADRRRRVAAAGLDQDLFVRDVGQLLAGQPREGGAGYDKQPVTVDDTLEPQGRFLNHRQAAACDFRELLWPVLSAAGPQPCAHAACQILSRTSSHPFVLGTCVPH